MLLVSYFSFLLKRYSCALQTEFFSEFMDHFESPEATELMLGCVSLRLKFHFSLSLLISAKNVHLFGMHV